MSLTELWVNSHAQLQNRHVRQIIAFAGNGKLLDGGPTSAEFREFLAQVPSAVLSAYADECLKEAFTDSGLVLQDIVNEIGRRLGFSVANGRYRGAGGHIGADGIWSLPDTRSIIVEVKTTDAYRIDLNTLAGYKREILKKDHLAEEHVTLLIVVGRTDTGDLEAQIRGSRYAWEMRLISIDALVRLLSIKEELDDPATVAKIHEILIPREFTKLDEIVDILFSTAEEAKEDALSVIPAQESGTELVEEKKFTPVSFNQECIDRLEQIFGRTLVKRSRITFSAPDDSVTVVCAVSKNHGHENQPGYWFAFHAHHKATLANAKEPYVAYGCGSPSLIFVIPFADFVQWVPTLNVTQSDNRAAYWHVVISGTPSGYVLTRRAGYPPISLDKYRVQGAPA